jgi:CRP-like cAMP-binding protein
MNKLFPTHSDHPLFRYFTEDERSNIEKIGELKTIAEGEYLIRAGEIDSTLFAVEDGHLDIMGTRVGKPAVVATVGPGDVLGEVAFIDDSPRSVSVRAGEERVRVRAWPKKKLSDALALQPRLLAKFSVALCELLVERLRDTARRV